MKKTNSTDHCVPWKLKGRKRVCLFAAIVATCFFTFSVPASAANQDDRSTKIDSLISLIAELPTDISLVEAYDNLLDAYYFHDASLGLSYVNDALHVANELGPSNQHVSLLRNIGLLHVSLRQFDDAIYYQEQGLSMANELELDKAILDLTRDLARSHANAGTYVQAWQYHDLALAQAKKMKLYNTVASILMDQAWLLQKQGDFTGGVERNAEAKAVLLEHDGDIKLVAVCLANIGFTYDALGQDSLALHYIDSANVVLKEVGDYPNYCTHVIYMGDIHLRNGNLLEAESMYNTALSENVFNDRFVNILAYLGLARLANKKDDENGAKVSFYKAYHEAKDLGYTDQQLEALIGLGNLYMSTGKLDSARHAFDQGDSLFHITNDGKLRMGYLMGLELLDSASGQWQKAYQHFKEGIRLRDQIEDDENTKRILQVTVQHEFDTKQAKARALREKRELRQRIIRNATAGTLAGAVIFLVILYRQRNRIAEARKRSDELLLNILPEEVAEELKEKGHSDAHFIDHVTVIFTDFKGFTALSEKVTPKELVKDLHECFSAFDSICEKYGIEKIKTIGDAYMAAGGLPSPNTTHAQDVVNAALEMAEVIERGKDKKITAGLPYFEIRIGVHTGPVVAGIVGVKKFQYDIWGDTVNTASRIESNGQVGKVNISQATYELLKDDSNFTFESRGKIEAKGKGEIEMYFVSKK